MTRIASLASFTCAELVEVSKLAGVSLTEDYGENTGFKLNV